MADTCVDIKQPTPSISLINNQNQIYISFDKEVQVKESLIGGDPQYSITVTGNQPSYKFDSSVPSTI